MVSMLSLGDFRPFPLLYRSRSTHYATQYKARFPRTPYASNRVSETMGVEEWANCRRGRVRESKCGMMCLTQAQPLLPPIKEERPLPVSCVRYTQMKSQGSEEFQHGFATAVG